MDKETTPNNSLKSWFEQVYSRQFSDAEFAEYKDRIVKLFEVLIEVDQRNRRDTNEATTN